MVHKCYLSKATPKNESLKSLPLMLDFTETESREVIRTAQQINIKLYSPDQNHLVKFYSIGNFNYLKHKLKYIKIIIWGL